MAPKYEKLDPITHMHRRPDMYVGSTSEIVCQQTEWICKSTDEITITASSQHKYIPALLRIFIEVVSNAVDNVWRSQQQNVVCKRLEITIDQEKNEFSVLNDGLIIPFMDYHAETGVRIPELIFGHLMTSTNYNDEEERLTSGRNGLGANLSNVFSSQFSVEIFDESLEQVYIQKWKNHMRNCGDPVIKPKKGKGSYVKVKWTPDLNLFGVSSISKDMMSMFYKYCVDIAAITKIPIKLNGNKIFVKQYLDYVKLYPDITEHVVLSKIQDMEVVLTNATGYGYQQIVFTNGIHNRDGGVYVDLIMNEVLRLIKQALTSKKQACPLSNRELREYFQIFVNARLKNPEFNNQSKDRVMKPSLKSFDIEPKAITQIMKWKWRDQLTAIVERKELNQMKKTERKKVRIEGYDPANLAGTKHSSKCTLILCEGLSAKTYAVTGIETGWNQLKGRDYYGIMALRGKVLNVRNASNTSISANREITNVLQALNLKYKMDYSQDENFRQLDYGKVLLLTDSDNDGTHIASLIINYFDVLFPTLLDRDFLYIMKTPIAKANKEVFYNEYEYHKFLERIQGQKKYDIKYYKGLGTSNTQEIRETFGKKVLKFNHDSLSSSTLNMVFHSKLSNDRKEWIEKFDPNIYTEYDTEYPISAFINQELIRFSIDDCRRNIPNLFDGLKTSQRKILYAVFKKNLKQSMKVAQLSGYVAEVSNYHHGEQCLLETIIRMAQSFVGSNNIPLLYPEGQFGSRSENGRDAASGRYIFTRMQSYTRNIFLERDDQLLHYIFDDNDRVEPEFYLPVIPMIMVNGVSTAIGTGFSCSIPPYNVEEIIRYVRTWVAKKEEKVEEWNPEWIDDMTPYYKDYLGQIIKIDGTKFRSSGIIKELGNGKYRISELSVGMSTNKYKEYLEELVEMKKIKQLKNYSSASEVCFEFAVTSSDFVPSLETMKLTSLIHLSNMVLFTKDFKLKKYQKLSTIFCTYCEERYVGYVQQKEWVLQNLKKELFVNEQKQKFLHLILSKQLDLSKYIDNDIDEVLERTFGLKKWEQSFQYLLSIQIHQLTKTRLDSLSKKIIEIKKEIARIQKLSPGDFWVEDLDEFQRTFQK